MRSVRFFHWTQADKNNDLTCYSHPHGVVNSSLNCAFIASMNQASQAEGCQTLSPLARTSANAWYYNTPPASRNNLTVPTVDCILTAKKQNIRLHAHRARPAICSLHDQLGVVAPSAEAHDQSILIGAPTIFESSRKSFACADRVDGPHGVDFVQNTRAL